jgi:Concanavalin A-like lectin/glucanases superfamily
MLRAVGVKWTGKERLAGNVLKPGWLKFESGWVEVQFHRGARVVVEGPAEFELITDMQARCLLGKVRAEVPPPAIGFEVLSPNVRVVDRGTSFGLEVKRDGPAEIHVFSGKVDLATTSSPQTRRELDQGKAVRVDRSGALSDIPNVTHDFTSTDKLESEAIASMAARFKGWQVYSAMLREDPSLVVQYTFESLADRRLQNMAPQATPRSHGTIIGCSGTDGRWPGKRALDFKQIGDRVRLALPLKYMEMTCVTWIRLDALDRPYSALLMSGDAAVGELQWQLGNKGQVLFGKRKEPGWGSGKLHMAESTRILTPQRCGSWMQLAFVYDSRGKTLTHYLDGQQVSVSPMDAQTPLTTGALEIGNWTPTVGDPKIEPIRAFNGRMDEFLVFSRALRPGEIQRHWEAGRPL